MRGCGHIGYAVKTFYFSQNLHFYSLAQTIWVMISKEFYDHMGRSCDHIDHRMKMHQMGKSHRTRGGWLKFSLFSCVSVYSTLIAIVLRGHAAFLSHLGFLGHLSHSCDLLLWVGVRRRLSCVNIFFSRTTGPILTKFGV